MCTNLINELKEVFEGEPWYGVSVLGSLQAVPVEVLNYKPYAAGHSIAVLLKHMLAWRVFVLEKLKENSAYSIEINSSADWDNDFIIRNENEWQQLVKALKASQRELIALLQEREEAWLAQQVPGKNYNYRHLLNGMLYHDIYHLGQIRLSWKMAEAEVRRG
ncbi:DinB family protein [Cesiribacter sp. SM1]|uniref:DinB family protein n=1 Tax=Cesiribacter sp. SM1 TaxID=2861196 RepID=UPI001CD65352|nr:DinB family protein [Cesiribacter sp. SM1]